MKTQEWEKEFDKKWYEGLQTGGFRRFVKDGLGFQIEMEDESKDAVKSFIRSLLLSSQRELLERVKELGKWEVNGVIGWNVIDDFVKEQRQAIETLKTETRKEGV